MSEYLNKRLKSLKPYVPGEQPVGERFYKLNTNESPFPPARQGINYAYKADNLCHLYPDPECRVLTDRATKIFKVKSEQILFTEGSDEALNFIVMAYCNKKKPIYAPNITYGFYSVLANLHGIAYNEIPLNDDFTINIDDYKNLDGIIFLANPNAPTGIALTVKQIDEIVSANDNIVVVDQAYVDFCDEDCTHLIRKHKNLIIVGTFSKSRSLAGARIGYVIANEQLINDVRTIKFSCNPYGISTSSMALGIGALEEWPYMKENCKRIKNLRRKTATKLKRLGFTMTNSGANFLFIKHETISGRELYMKLREKHILVRRWGDNPLIKDYLRVTIGSEHDMDIFVTRMTNIIKRIKK